MARRITADVLRPVILESFSKIARSSSVKRIVVGGIRLGMCCTLVVWHP